MIELLLLDKVSAHRNIHRVGRKRRGWSDGRPIADVCRPSNTHSSSSNPLVFGTVLMCKGCCGRGKAGSLGTM